MTTTLNSGIEANIQTLLRTLAQITGKDIDLANSKSFRAVLDCPDGKAINFRVFPLDQGVPTTQNATASESLDVPTDGPADFDGVSGTTTLVASTKDVTIAGGVPTDAVVYATHTTPGGVPKYLAAARKDADEITISSAGDGFGALLDSAGVQGTLAAGHLDTIALANVAGDLLAVKEVTPGGSAADHFSVVRVSDSLVKVQAHDSAGALVAGNTSVVKAYNFGQKGHDTSVVRYAVIRP